MEEEESEDRSIQTHIPNCWPSNANGWSPSDYLDLLFTAPISHLLLLLFVVNIVDRQHSLDAHLLVSGIHQLNYYPSFFRCMNRVEEVEEEESLDYSLSVSSLNHQMAPESGNGTLQGAERIGKVSSISSIDSIDPDQEAYFSDCPSETDLDRLSMCLSEVSSDAADRKKPSLFSDIIQAQLALWTLIFSIFYSYAWQQHRKKFLLSLFFVVPPVILVCCTISSLLTTIVILGRVFSAPLSIQQMFRMGKPDEDEVQTNLGSNYGGSGNLRRKRSMSGNSCHSTNSNRSSSCEELPKPVCRKHSTSQHGGSSLSLVCGTPTSPLGNGFANGFTASHNGFGHSYSNGLNSRSLSVSGTAPKLSYQYSHSAGGGDLHQKNL
uniref:Uncharacterized protein n=1 Tax=Ditylenchus dipsaci TaxID=166011 RepID=A0A915DJT0_9BILA